ncbi:MAG: hypothetical protein GF344_06525 [Chitinivibrionales bacterium]|nr:hypothetical protein [Chitinivibrionales bacterium]MBD3356581.1 hypothetical protein [Chitinivibrionales bacterium]
MKRFAIMLTAAAAVSMLVGAVFAEGDAKKADKYLVAAKSAEEGGGDDTLVITARVVEIPGTFPPNDLYNYVYVMKYRVLDVEKGDYDGREILVGHYNPLIPRSQVDDKMDEYVDGNVKKFEKGSKQRLVLVSPISKVWNEAMEDEYFDSEDPKFYALKADVAQ